MLNLPYKCLSWPGTAPKRIKELVNHLSRSSSNTGPVRSHSCFNQTKQTQLDNRIFVVEMDFLDKVEKGGKKKS